MARRRQTPKGASRAQAKPLPNPEVLAGPTPAVEHGPATGQEEARRGMAAFKKSYLERTEKNRARRMAQIKALKSKQKWGKAAKYGGIGALALLGGSLAKNAVLREMGASEDQLMDKAMADLVNQAQQSRVNQLSDMARAQSYQDSIDMNLQRIQQYAPDLYMAVAAGRRLPTGAVVLGGAPRTDLLQELGRSMADGRFNQ